MIYALPSIAGIRTRIDGSDDDYIYDFRKKAERTELESVNEIILRVANFYGVPLTEVEVVRELPIRPQHYDKARSKRTIGSGRTS